MTTSISRLVGVAALVLLHADFVSAQDRPVAFIHGLTSHADTWQAAATRLAAQLQIDARRPDPDWNLPFPNQAQQVQNELASLPGSTVAVGHSNGGVVAREWSRSRQLGGLVTLGTPNQGAPLASNAASWAGFNLNVGFAISDVFSIFSQCVIYGCGWQWVIFQDGLDTLLGQFTGWLTGSWYLLAAELGVYGYSPVLADMVPGSPYMNSLNSSANLGREVAAVPARVGIISIAHNFYDAGAFRAVWPDSADTIDFYKDLSIYLLDFWSAWIRANADFSDSWAWELANHMSTASSWLAWIDPFWCGTVSSSGGGACDYNDTIVPVWSQVLPNAPFLLAVDGPTHTQETQNSDYWLYQALTTFTNIPPRGSGGGSGSTGSASMTQDSAIRGCSSWSWWNPVWQPDPPSCSSYCVSNGANACEWFQDGSCYVEFGNNCSVQGGFGGWWAQVVNAGAGAGTSSGGGGTAGGPQMTEDAAIRGCAGWWWWDPVWKPDPQSCSNYCASNGANACEWFQDGSCFVEFSSGGCYVQRGYGGWFAAVIQ